MNCQPFFLTSKISLLPEIYGLFINYSIEALFINTICQSQGMELMNNKFSVITTSIRKRPYDFLDQRKMEFDQDYEDFKRQISDLHVSIPKASKYF